MTRSLLAILMWLLPRAFRRRHGADLRQLHEDLLAGATPAARVRLALGLAWDVVAQAVRLRWRGVPHEPAGERAGRQARGVEAWIDGLRQDALFAARSLIRRPGFTGAATLVLALGIGSTTAVFSVVNGVLLRPLPYEASSRIGVIWHDFHTGAQSLPLLNPLDLYDYRAWSRTMARFTFGAGYERLVTDEASGRPTIMDVTAVEAGFFDFFGIAPLHGRAFGPEDDQPGAPRVALMTHRLWRTRYGGSLDVVGRPVYVDGVPHEIVGILPEDFQLHLPAETIFLRDADLWRPAQIDPAQLGSRTATMYTAFARLADGVSFSAAQEELDTLAARLRDRYPAHAAAETRARIVAMKDDVVKAARPALNAAFAAVGLVLLVACANAANLLLIRVRGRETELAIRTALGAGRRRVVRLVMLESLFVAAIGGLVGLVLARLGLRAVQWLGRDTLPRVDARARASSALWVAAGTAALAAGAAGLFPARGAARSGGGHVPASGRVSASRSSARARDGLIVVEVALSLMLVIGTGLLLQTLHALQRVEPGYATDGVVTLRVALPESATSTPLDQIALLRDLEGRLRRRPDVAAVAATTQIPLTGPGYLQPYAFDEASASQWESTTSDRRWVTPGYFEAMGAVLLAGRDYTWDDLTRPARVLIVDERLASHAFPDGKAVGGQIRLSPNGPPWSVIGVAAHQRLHEITRPGHPQIYSAMRPSSLFSGRGLFTLVVRTPAPAEVIMPVVIRELDALAPGTAVGEARTMADLVTRATAPTRALLVMMTAFGVIAAALASIGLYAVITFSVRQRTREIGIRMMLGQSPAGVRRLVFGHGMRLIGLAAVIGLAASAVEGRLAAGLLYGVAPIDVPTYVGATGLLAACGLLATWLPARRATRTDPVRALRAD
ncbi:MAG: ABC transporter permease [Vicinamibacterales bacterium]